MAQRDDRGLRFVMLGALRGAVALGNFPVAIDDIQENADAEGTIQSFTVTTLSGLRYEIRVERRDDRG